MGPRNRSQRRIEVKEGLQVIVCILQVWCSAEACKPIVDGRNPADPLDLDHWDHGTMVFLVVYLGHAGFCL